MSMGLRNRTNDIDWTAEPTTRRRRAVTGREETVCAPSKDAYLTDETALFRVAEAISNRGELFFELENCKTLELILCPARTVTKRGLRKVTPALTK
jgi:hypothetical protein